MSKNSLNVCSMSSVCEHACALHHLREAEEESGGPHQEEGGGRHGHVARRPQGPTGGRGHGVGEGRRGSAPAAALRTAAAARHHFLSCSSVSCTYLVC